MLTTVNGYYDGFHIVISDKIELKKGQRVTITADISETPSEKKVDLSRFMGHGKKLFADDPDKYVKELRENDRI
ncbi:MAG: hypothetical protein IJM51_09320 [Clostridia bacterium]|nr:hypothetical protein [Clostridia bacterium]